jgi:hypothetical protein
VPFSISALAHVTSALTRRTLCSKPYVKAGVITEAEAVKLLAAVAKKCAGEYKKMAGACDPPKPPF